MREICAYLVVGGVIEGPHALRCVVIFSIRVSFFSLDVCALDFARAIQRVPTVNLLVWHCILVSAMYLFSMHSKDGIQIKVFW
jgi:hypothetical protein